MRRGKDLCRGVHVVRTSYRGMQSSIGQERQGFGSFHSRDIEEMIYDLQPPHVFSIVSASTPEKVRDMISSISASVGNGSSSSSSRISRDGVGDDDSKDLYGVDIRRSGLFGLENKWTFLNHGAFGATLVPLLEEAEMWRRRCESQPLRFYDRELLPMIAYSTRKMANHLNCPVDELYPLPNVTTGLNAVINGLDLQPDDVICYLSLTYGSTKKIISEACERNGAMAHMIDLPLPILSKAHLVEMLRVSLISLQGKSPKAIVIDQITSNTALKLPIKEISTVCRAFGMKVIIDGAHALNMERVDIYKRNCSNGSTNDDSNEELAVSDVADYWIGNCHKWLCAPKGAAFMWCKKGLNIRPRVISHGFVDGGSKMLSAFSWDGCRDYASLLTIPSTLLCWNGILPESTSYNHRLMLKARDLFYQDWEIDTNTDVPCRDDELLANSMCLVPLPSRLRSYQQLSNTSSVTRIVPTDAQAFQLQELLHNRYRIEVPVKCLEGRLYVRISCHIYNYMQEYEHLSNVVQRIMG